VPKVTDNPGAAWNEQRQKWFARITVEGVRKHLGYFESPGAASEAYIEARDEKARTRVVLPPARAPAVKPRNAGPIPPEMMAALFSPSFINVYVADYGQDETFQEAAAIVAEVSRSEGVSSWVASEVFVAAPGDTATLEFLPVAEFRERIQLLRRLGLLERLPEILDRVFRLNDNTTFAKAVAETAFGDLV
jgi:hypothetical protein